MTTGGIRIKLSHTYSGKEHWMEKNYCLWDDHYPHYIGTSQFSKPKVFFKCQMVSSRGLKTWYKYYDVGPHKFSYTFKLLIKPLLFTQMRGNKAVCRKQDSSLSIEHFKADLLYVQCLATFYWDKRQRLGCKPLHASSEDGLYNCETCVWNPHISILQSFNPWPRKLTIRIGGR